MGDKRGWWSEQGGAGQQSAGGLWEAQHVGGTGDVAGPRQGRAAVRQRPGWGAWERGAECGCGSRRGAERHGPAPHGREDERKESEEVEEAWESVEEREG